MDRYTKIRSLLTFYIGGMIMKHKNITFNKKHLYQIFLIAGLIFGNVFCEPDVSPPTEITQSDDEQTPSVESETQQVGPVTQAPPSTLEETELAAVLEAIDNFELPSEPKEIEPSADTSAEEMTTPEEDSFRAAKEMIWDRINSIEIEMETLEGQALQEAIEEKEILERIAYKIEESEHAKEYWELLAEKMQSDYTETKEKADKWHKRLRITQVFAAATTIGAVVATAAIIIILKKIIDSKNEAIKQKNEFIALTKDLKKEREGFLKEISELHEDVNQQDETTEKLNLVKTYLDRVNRQDQEFVRNLREIKGMLEQKEKSKRRKGTRRKQIHNKLNEYINKYSYQNNNS